MERELGPDRALRRRHPDVEPEVAVEASSHRLGFQSKEMPDLRTIAMRQNHPVIRFQQIEHIGDDMCQDGVTAVTIRIQRR